MSEDEEMTIFFLTTLAIYISGDVKDQTFVCGYREANNGKSGLIGLLRWLFVHAVLPASDGLLIDTGGKQGANAHTSQYDAIKNARLIYQDETKLLCVISEATIKKIT